MHHFGAGQTFQPTGLLHPPRAGSMPGAQAVPAYIPPVTGGSLASRQPETQNSEAFLPAEPRVVSPRPPARGPARPPGALRTSITLFYHVWRKLTSFLLSLLSSQSREGAREPSEGLGCLSEGARLSLPPSAELLELRAPACPRGVQSGETSWQSWPVCPLPLWGGLGGPGPSLAGTCLKREAARGSWPSWVDLAGGWA